MDKNSVGPQRGPSWRFLRQGSKLNLRFVKYGFFLAAFSIVFFAVFLELATPFLHYSIVFVVSAAIVYTVGYLLYSSKVFMLRPSLRGYLTYLSGTLVNFVSTLTLLFILVELTVLGPLISRILIAVVLAPAALWFHQKYSFGRSNLPFFSKSGLDVHRFESRTPRP